MQNDIVEHLKNTYSPDAIILHGSRARGKERENSDWDIVLLYNNPTEFMGGRELYKEQNIEYSIQTLPIDNIFKQFAAKLQEAKVLYEKNQEGTYLLEQAQKYYSDGVHWSTERTAGHKLWMTGRIDGMKDSMDEPLVFNKYFTDFYSQVFNYWYWIRQNKHSQPIYIAAKEVLENDSQYYSLLSDLINLDNSPGDKIAVSEKICRYLFE